MTKQTAGICVVLGLLGAAVSIAVAGMIGQMPGRPDTDWMLQLGQLGFGVLGIGCIVMFFVGALRFSKGE
jgi:hypothetical protein